MAFAQNMLVVNKKNGTKEEVWTKVTNSIYFVDVDDNCDAVKAEETGLVFEFDETNRTATLLRTAEDPDSLIIPVTVCHDKVTFKVTAIKCRDTWEVDQTSYVVIPNTVKYLGKKSFYNSQITNIALPDSLEWIDESVFYNTNIRRIVLPPSVKYVGYHALCSEYLDTIILSKTTQLHSYACCNYVRDSIKTVFIYRDEK